MIGVLFLFLFLSITDTLDHFIFTYNEKDRVNAQSVIKYAEPAFLRICSEFQYTPSKPISIYLVSTHSEFKELAKDGFPDWGAGCAYPARSLIILKSPRLVKKNVIFQTLVAHEISHCVLGDMLKGIWIPRWFDEGIAMYESHEWQFGEGFILSWANFTNSIIPLSQIERVFPQKLSEARLAYVESFSTISFIIQEFGREALLETIKFMKETISFDLACKKALGLSKKDFEIEWLKWAKRNHSGFVVLLKDFFPYMIILIIFFIVVFFTLIQRKSKFSSKHPQI